MRELNAREAACRTAVGELAAALCRHKAYQRLGFARLGDYTRERLGLSPREVESLGQVIAALRRLPTIAAAFAAGELSWTRTRLLTTVAYSEDEVAWLARTRRCSTAQLAESVRGTVANASADSADAATISPGAADPGRAATSATGAAASAGVAAGDHPASRSRLTAAALEEALDRIDGEPAARFRLRCPPRLRGLFYDTIELARRVSGAPLPIAHAAEAIAAEALSGAPHPPTDPAPAAVEDSVSAKARGCAATPPVETAIPTLDPFDLDARLREAVHALHSLDWEIGRVLEAARRQQLHRILGFRAFADYLRDRTAIPPRTARALMAAERVTATCLPLREAYRAGDVSWLQTLTLAPMVLRAPDDIGAAWVARARRVTLRRLTDEVAWALARRDAGDRAPIMPPPLDSRLDHDEEWQIGAPAAVSSNSASPDAGVAFANQPPSEPLMAEITFTGPASIVVLFRAAITAFAATAHEPAASDEPATSAASSTGSGSSAEPLWRSCERMLRHVRDTWRALPRHRDPIFERDGWRCTVPGCSGRRNLHDHHVHFRSRGGDNRRINRTAVCAGHHLHGIHIGALRCWGTAPHALRWQLGIHGKSGTSSWALLDLLGDRYLDHDEILADRAVQKRVIAARLVTSIPLDGNSAEMIREPSMR